MQHACNLTLSCTLINNYIIRVTAMLAKAAYVCDAMYNLMKSSASVLTRPILFVICIRSSSYN